MWALELAVLGIRNRIRIWIGIHPHHFGNLDPHPDPHSVSNKNQDPDPDQHQSDKLDPESDPDPHQLADDKPKCMEYESI